MRAFQCRCGRRVFFHSLTCVACGNLVARCPRCREVAAVEQSPSGTLRCFHCQADVRLCENRLQHSVCNAATLPGNSLCSFCALNDVVPDLSDEANLGKWRLLERAKHRVLYDAERIGLPISLNASAGPPLVFDFLASDNQPVSTGHVSGRITIDIAEADSVHREQTRVAFGEPQRTLVGHFRHELGHYYWEVMVVPKRIDEYRSLFGDERQPSYAEAQKRYYTNDAPVDWQSRYVSQYATMHSWEDFAETFNAYLDMVAIVTTASYFQRIKLDVDLRDFDALLDAYRAIGIVANEMNRDMGLLDLVPEVFTPPVIEKLRFVHQLPNLSSTAAMTDDAT